MSSLSVRSVAFLVSVLLLSSCKGQTHDGPAASTHSDEPVVTGEPAGNNAADFMFTNSVIAQDQQGIDVAALVPSRNANADFAAFAATSASARRSEVTILKVMQVQWNSDQDSPAGPRNESTTKGMINPPTIAELQSLHGGAFQTLWLQSMVGLDEASIEIANTEIANGKNIDAAGVAKQIVAGRQAEIDQLKKLSGT